MEVNELNPPYKRRTNRSCNLKTLPAEERIAIKREEKKRKKTESRSEYLIDFKPITTGRLWWKGNKTRVQFDTPRRGYTLLDIFSRFVTSDILESILTIHFRFHRSFRVSHNDLLQMMAVKIYLHTKPKPTLKECFPLPKDRFPRGMSRHRYHRLASFVFRKDVVRLLDRNYASLVSVWPECVCIDEKHKGVCKKTNCSTFVKGKKPSEGHWISEACIIASQTGQPYLIHELPVQREPTTMLMYFRELLGDIPLSIRHTVVVVSDAFYIDEASRRWLRTNGFLYLAAVNPKRFAEVWPDIDARLSQDGDWALSWNEKTSELAGINWHKDYNKQYLITNAFGYIDDKKVTLKEYLPGMYYSDIFLDDDRLNHFLHNRYFPYRRTGGYIMNYDDFHWSILLWNVYTVFHEDYEKTGTHPFTEDMLHLSYQLWESTLSDESSKKISNE